MSGLVAKIELIPGSGTWVDRACGFTNQTGTPVFSAAANGLGEAIPGEYSLAFSSVVAGVSATVTVSASDTNIYNGRVVAGVLLDELSISSDVIPGIDLVFDSSATNGNVADVRVGKDWGSLAAFPPAAGTPGTPMRVQVVNTHPTDTIFLPAATLKPMPIRKKKTGEVFARVRPFAPTAVQKFTGNKTMPYVLAVSGVTGVGALKVMDLTLDGAPIATVTNLTDSSSSDSSGLNVVDYYRAEDGDGQTIEFLLSENAVDGDFENLLIFAPRFLQLAPDVGGPAPGIWGSADVTLAAELAPAGVAYYWERPLVPDGGNSESNPYPMEVSLEGQVASSAGWDA